VTAAFGMRRAAKSLMRDERICLLTRFLSVRIVIYQDSLSVCTMDNIEEGILA